MAGPVLTTVPTRVQVDKATKISSYLQSISQQTIDVIPHQHAGIQRIRRLAPSTSAACDFQNLLVVQADDQALAKRWAMESLHHAVPTRDPRAVAHSLESVALVDDDPHAAALAGGAAWALRRSAAAPLPTVQQQPLSVRRRALARALGSEFTTAWSRGVGDPRGVAVDLAAGSTAAHR